MKWIIFISFCVFNFNKVFGQKIIWKEDQKLAWSDFKSKSNNMGNANVVAYTHCGWEYSAVVSSDSNVPVKIGIQTIFKENQSWKDVKRITDYALLHEQKHFDIAELFARRLRKEVEEKVVSSGDYIKYFHGIYNKIAKDYKDFQASYDRDTRNGINTIKQAEYNTLITEELEKLKKYKNVEISQ